MVLIKLFISFFKIGLFSFGGGYAMLPLIQNEVVKLNKWLGPKEFVDVIAISQATPGPIAINSATYVGYKIAGIIGASVATLGVTIPSFVIILIMAKFFMSFKDNKYMDYAFEGLRPAVVGLVLAAAIMVGMSAFADYKSIIIFIAVFIASYKYDVDPILLIAGAGLTGYLLY